MMLTEKKLPGAPARANGFMKRWKNDRSLYIMLTPVLLYYIIFMYVPMYGAIIAFQDYRPSGGILGSKWVGFKHFVDFFTDPFFARVLCNTLTISITNIFFLFTMPIVLALLLNELGNGWYKKTVQTISYFPHFISIIVTCIELGKFYTMPRSVIDIRCDLHPRWNETGSMISFDSTHEGRRGIYLVQFEEIKEAYFENNE